MGPATLIMTAAWGCFAARQSSSADGCLDLPAHRPAELAARIAVCLGLGVISNSILKRSNRWPHMRIRVVEPCAATSIEFALRKCIDQGSLGDAARVDDKTRRISVMAVIISASRPRECRRPPPQGRQPPDKNSGLIAPRLPAKAAGDNCWHQTAAS